MESIQYKKIFTQKIQHQEFIKKLDGFIDQHEKDEGDQAEQDEQIMNILNYLTRLADQPYPCMWNNRSRRKREEWKITPGLS